MATVSFTPNLERHVERPTPAEGALRRCRMGFVDGQQIEDRQRFSDPVRPASEIYVMQALSRRMMMSHLLISTREGLFAAEPAGEGDRVARAAFVGESWSVVSHHLPPVHAVAFVE